MRIPVPRDASGGQTGNIRTQLWYYYGKWVSLRFARLRGFIFWLAVAPIWVGAIPLVGVGPSRFQVAHSSRGSERSGCSLVVGGPARVERPAALVGMSERSRRFCFQNVWRKRARFWRKRARRINLWCVAMDATLANPLTPKGERTHR